MNEPRITNQGWISIPGISIVLIFMNGILPSEVVIVIQIILLIFLIGKIKIERSFAIAFFLILIQSLICIMIGDDTLSSFLKQYVSIIISATYWLTCITLSNINEYIDLYKRAAIFTSFVAIFQFIASLLGLNSLSNMQWLVKSQQQTTGGRAAAFLNEPSVCALVLFPIFFLGLYKLIGKNRKFLEKRISTWETLVVFMGFASTVSSSGFIGAAIAVLIIAFEYGFKLKQLVIFFLVFVLFGYLYNNVSFVNERIGDTLDVINGSKNLSLANVSTQTLILNKDIAFDSFKYSHGLGSGLGSHPISYAKYINGYNAVYLYHLNQEDANSMFLRIISELGVLGIGIYILFLFGYRIKKGERSIYKIISLMCLGYILMRMTRFGHYFDCGYFMFISLYYRCYQVTKYREKINNGE